MLAGGKYGSSIMTKEFYERERALLTLKIANGNIREVHDAKKDLDELDRAWFYQCGTINKMVLNRWK